MDTEEVKAFLSEAASVEVKCFRWWFWMTGDESVLNLVHGGIFSEFWKIKKSFLESVAVRVLPH